MMVAVVRRYGGPIAVYGLVVVGRWPTCFRFCRLRSSRAFRSAALCRPLGCVVAVVVLLCCCVFLWLSRQGRVKRGSTVRAKDGTLVWAGCGEGTTPRPSRTIRSPRPAALTTISHSAQQVACSSVKVIDIKGAQQKGARNKEGRRAEALASPDLRTPRLMASKCDREAEAPPDDIRPSRRAKHLHPSYQQGV